jgi:chorismate synthase
MSFRFLTAGESHGKALVGIMEGLPSGMEIGTEYLAPELKRRKLGYGRGARQKIEDDAVEFMSGVRHGKTLGSPIAMMIANKDWKVWQEVLQPEPFSGEVKRRVDVPRPGHADLIGGIKYAHKDMRNVLERSSARETAMRVALGTVARKFLQDLGIDVGSRVTAIGQVSDETEVPSDLLAKASLLNQAVDDSPLRCLGKSAEKLMVSQVETAKKEGNTLGGIFEVFASGVPRGLGSYSQWDRRLEAGIGSSFLSLNAIKGVEIGMGFKAGITPGTQVHDELFPAEKPAPGHFRFQTNRSGGIDGGMSTGQPIVVRAAMKPLSTLMKPIGSVNLSTGEGVKAHVERSDVCAVPAAAVIGESLLCLCLAASILEKFGGDSMSELKPRVDAWRGLSSFG